jgi:hypothetical protein
MKDNDLLKDGLEAFKLHMDAEEDNRKEALDDLRFGRLGEQWDEKVKSNREMEGRPCLTFNKLPTFVRQVVNEARQNKPAIKVHPADSEADVETADIINGLIRNIEYSSNADTAYDVGLEYAVSCGFGYWRIAIEYACDDTFDKDIKIQAITNPFSVYGDYADTGMDSANWNSAFIVDSISKEEFKRKYKGAEESDWEDDGYQDMDASWTIDKNIRIAEWWRREETEEKILKLSSGIVVPEKWLAYPVDGMEGMTNQDLINIQGIQVVADRMTKTYAVKQCIMSGAEILEKNDWVGRYIPIVPVYGEDITVDGRRYLRSLIRDAKDAQRNYNYWRTSSTELVALAPKTPFIGAVGSFVTDADKWATANTASHAYIEYDPVSGGAPPQRQGFAGVPAGAMQEALNSSDDMKSVIGIYDATLGARSNETSGRAITARQRQSQTSTFHFVDNQSRAIRHTGKIILDLIPYVYNEARIVRVMGVDKTPENVAINQQQQPGQPTDDKGMAQVFDLTVGKYDLTVDTGPSFATRREEAATQMNEFMKVMPQAAPLLGDLLAKNLDWPDADEVAKRLKIMLPPQLQEQPEGEEQNPQVMQMQQEMQQMQEQVTQTVQQLQQANDQLLKENQAMKADVANESKATEIDQFKAETDRMKVQIDAQKAETERVKAEAEIQIKNMELQMKAQDQAQMQAHHEAMQMGGIGEMKEEKSPEINLTIPVNIAPQNGSGQKMMRAKKQADGSWDVISTDAAEPDDMGEGESDD